MNTFQTLKRAGLLWAAGFALPLVMLAVVSAADSRRAGLDVAEAFCAATLVNAAIAYSVKNTRLRPVTFVFLAFFAITAVCGALRLALSLLTPA